MVVCTFSEAQRFLPSRPQQREIYDGLRMLQDTTHTRTPRSGTCSDESTLVLQSRVHIARAFLPLMCSSVIMHPVCSWSTLDKEMYLMWEVPIPSQSKYQNLWVCSMPENALLPSAVRHTVLHTCTCIVRSSLYEHSHTVHEQHINNSFIPDSVLLWASYSLSFTL